MSSKRFCLLTGSVVSLLVVSCVISPAWAGEREQVEPIQANAEIPEEELLDVGIQVLDPGLPEEDETALEEERIFREVRKSESRFIPFHLKNTLQATGYWGAVRLVPAEADAADVTVSGEILSSTGKGLVVKLRVVDAVGREWIDKRYKETADPRAYKEEEDEIAPPDPYQNLYNRIANDLLAERNKLTTEEIWEVRTIRQLRFAADLAPAPFQDYLRVRRKGRYVIERLPAEDDPMMERIARIRERDYMFVDTLNEYYATFYAQMDEPYGHWRAFSYEEQVALEELRRAARWRKIVGTIAILGGILSDSGSASDVAVLGGIAAIQSGMQKSKEAKIHLEALKELGASFDSEVEPLLVQVEGQTLRLTGSAETQYTAWRELLRQIFATETGLPFDPNTNQPVTDGPEEN